MGASTTLALIFASGAAAVLVLTLVRHEVRLATLSANLDEVKEQLGTPPTIFQDVVSALISKSSIGDPYPCVESI